MYKRHRHRPPVVQKAGCVAGKKPKLPDLRQMLRETSEACIGLEYLEEVLPQDPGGSGDPPSSFICDLCCVTALSAPMFTHLMGNRHRVKYLEMKCNENQLSKSQVALRCQQIQEEQGKGIDLIQTVFSDVRYPWPPGKAPQRVKAARTEAVPDSSSSTSDDAEGLPLSDSPLRHLLKGLSHCAVKCEEDSRLAHEVAEKLIRSLARYKLKNSRPPLTQKLQLDTTEIIYRLQMLFAAPLNNFGTNERKSGNANGL